MKKTEPSKNPYIEATAIQASAVHSGDLLVWTVYQNPKDYPDKFVVRPHSTFKNEPMDFHFVCDNLPEVRATLPQGLTYLRRAPDDDPCAFESWI